MPLLLLLRLPRLSDTFNSSTTVTLLLSTSSTILASLYLSHSLTRPSMSRTRGLYHLQKWITLCRLNVSSLAPSRFAADNQIDDPEAYHGAPVAVQIIGRRLTEERVMSIAEEVGRLLENEITP